MTGKMYGVQKFYKQRESDAGYMTDEKLFLFKDERTRYIRKYILNKKSSRIKKVFLFECVVSNFREIELNIDDEKED